MDLSWAHTPEISRFFRLALARQLRSRERMQLEKQLTESQEAVGFSWNPSGRSGYTAPIASIL